MMRKKMRIFAILTLSAFLAGTLLATPALASAPFIGTIQAFGFNFNPRGWARCEGQLLPIAQNTALFALLGTIYGGDGRTTFALPDLRGRVPMGMGNGPGLTPRSIGQKSGAENVTLSTANLPAHTHAAAATMAAAGGQGDQQGPGGNVLAYDRRETQYSSAAPDVSMNAASVSVSVGSAGNSQSFNIMQPYLVVNYCIALQGLFPSRN